ncbi:hypothetical protein ACJMK2_019995 [Sinanodonta woodiana]|uniref:Dual specificity protein phosphatase n=1 Tax=Sinanodonta woodiana TaxID=1069815 RepID=A0ABD3TZD0_SINWO
MSDNDNEDDSSMVSGQAQPRLDDIDDRPCTIEELLAIITAPSGGLTMLPNEAYNESYPNIYLGEESVALDRIGLRNLGITHILNCALGKDDYHVNSNHVMYRPVNIKFMGIEADDMCTFNLTPWFKKAADFIEEAVSGGGKVMVHCVQGVSRSATILIAYLMLKQKMTVQQAVRSVRAKREICPNDGFLQQLCNLNENLKKKGHFS